MERTLTRENGVLYPLGVRRDKQPPSVLPCAGDPMSKHVVVLLWCYPLTASAG